MFNKYNFINIGLAAIAGITGGIYLYDLFPGYFSHPATSGFLYAVLLFMICYFAGRTSRSTWKPLDNKWFYSAESVIIVLLIILSYMYGHFDYWNSAGILLLGYIIIYHSKTIRENIIKFVLVFISPVFYYGIIFHHSFFTETIFAAAFLLLMDFQSDSERKDYNLILSSVIIGFLAFINPLLSILFLVFLIYRFRQNWGKGIIFILTGILSYYFIVSFLSDHIRFLSLTGFDFPVWTFVIFGISVIAAIYSGWISRNIYEVFFSSALIIFMLIIICGFSIQSFFPQILSLAYPLLILGIRDYSSENYLGKKLVD
jgi:hypothetical protein